MPFTQNQQVSIREVAVRGQGLGTVTVTFYNQENGESASTVPATITFSDDNHPIIVQVSAAARGTDITMTIAATGESFGPAPIIYSVSIGWQPGTQVNPT